MPAASSSSSPPTPRPETALFDFDDLEEQGSGLTAPAPRSPAALVVKAAAAPAVAMPRHGAAARNHSKPRAALRHFLTFGGGNYQASALRLANEVRALGPDVFQEVHAFTEFPDAVAEDPRWERHTRGDSKGYGWWFWKSALVNHLLREGTLRDGDTLAYGDAGCVVNRGSQRAWLSLIQRVEDPQGVDLVAFQHEHLEKGYTKGDTFEHFGMRWDSEDYGLTCQCVGGYWVTRINSRTREFLARWEELCANTNLISDDPPTIHNPSFIANRHDQSLLSMLVKSNKPVYVRADGAHFNAGRAVDARATCWRQPASERHRKFGVPDLKVVVLRDCGWPVTNDPAQPIAAARLSDSALFGGRGGHFEECD
uniref:Uncharacterized protein n=1 Tax=Alexandrium monilatum TaxID=311494 RepID=A0A7S4R3I3_9DINO